MKSPAHIVSNGDPSAPRSIDTSPGQGGESRRRGLPAIVRTVLCHLAKLRHQQLIPGTTFDLQIARIASEELQPRGLFILVRDLPDGRTRFLLKSNPHGEVQDLIEYPSPLEQAADDGALANLQTQCHHIP